MNFIISVIAFTFTLNVSISGDDDYHIQDVTGVTMDAFGCKILLPASYSLRVGRFYSSDAISIGVSEHNKASINLGSIMIIREDQKDGLLTKRKTVYKEKDYGKLKVKFYRVPYDKIRLATISDGKIILQYVSNANIEDSFFPCLAIV